jgi:hypothetical protein
MNFPKLACVVFVFFCLASCSDKKIELNPPSLSDYFPLTKGKYITYRLDSTVLTRFGADTTVNYYRVKDLIDAEITDGLGRKAYRILRTITDSAGYQPYTNDNTFMYVPQTTDWIEKVENNLRFMSLRNPIIEGFQWKGNSFIDALSENSNVKYLYNWDYTYQNIGQPFTIGGITYDNTITVLQRDKQFPEGPFVKTDPYKQWDYSIEVYAKGIGLVYKNFDHKVWQGPTPPPDVKAGYWDDGSYRVVLRAIDHN